MKRNLIVLFTAMFLGLVGCSGSTEQDPGNDPGAPGDPGDPGDPTPAMTGEGWYLTEMPTNFNPFEVEEPSDPEDGVEIVRFNYEPLTHDAFANMHINATDDYANLDYPKVIYELERTSDGRLEVASVGGFPTGSTSPKGVAVYRNGSYSLQLRIQYDNPDTDLLETDVLEVIDLLRVTQ